MRTVESYDAIRYWVALQHAAAAGSAAVKQRQSIQLVYTSLLGPVNNINGHLPCRKSLACFVTDPRALITSWPEEKPLVVMITLDTVDRT